MSVAGAGARGADVTDLAPWQRPPFEPGHTLTLQHGAYSPRLVGPLAAEIGEELEAIVAGTPAAAPMFLGARSALALKLARLRLVTRWLEDRGGMPIDGEGQPLSAARLEMELLASIEKSLNQLGLTPTAAARLGVDLARGSILQVGIDEHLAEGRRVRLEAEARHSGTAAAPARSDQDAAG